MWGLAGAFALQIASSIVVSEPVQAETAQWEQGGNLFAVNCSSCHGLSGEGTLDGPSLLGVGPAAVDFQLSTGRMPLSDPSQQPARQAPKFSPEQIDSLVAYVTSFAPGGAAIPPVDANKGDLSQGMKVFVNTCASCHGGGATGDSVGGGQIAPSLYDATPLQIGEAIRTGPGVMPQFGSETITDQQLNDISAYLLSLRTNETDVSRGGVQLGRVGPVAEGFVALVIGLGILTLVLYASSRKP